MDSSGTVGTNNGDEEETHEIIWTFGVTPNGVPQPSITLSRRGPSPIPPTQNTSTFGPNNATPAPASTDGTNPNRTTIPPRPQPRGPFLPGTLFAGPGWGIQPNNTFATPPFIPPPVNNMEPSRASQTQAENDAPSTNGAESINTSNPAASTDPTPAARQVLQPPQPPHPHWIAPAQLPHFFQFIFGEPVERGPDPEKAAELLRALPTVGKGLLKRVDKIYAAEEAGGPVAFAGMDDEEVEDLGWKCGICLEGYHPDPEGDNNSSGASKGKHEVDTSLMNQSKEEKEEKKDKEKRQVDDDDVKMDSKEDDKGTGVKVLPCNHLFHEACLEPWFQSKHTWYVP